MARLVKDVIQEEASRNSMRGRRSSHRHDHRTRLYPDGSEGEGEEGSLAAAEEALRVLPDASDIEASGVGVEVNTHRKIIRVLYVL